MQPLAQQGRGLVIGQTLPGLDGALAGQGNEHGANVVLAAGQHLAQEFPGLAAGQGGRDAPGQQAAAGAGDIEAHALQIVAYFQKALFFHRLQGQLQRQGQALGRAREGPLAQTLVKHALVRRVLVQQHQGAGSIAQDKVGLGHLAQIGQAAHHQLMPSGDAFVRHGSAGAADGLPGSRQALRPVLLRYRNAFRCGPVRAFTARHGRHMVGRHGHAGRLPGALEKFLSVGGQTSRPFRILRKGRGRKRRRRHGFPQARRGRPPGGEGRRTAGR